MTDARALFAAWLRRYQEWRRRAENPEPLDFPVPPGHEALIYEEYGDRMDPKSRPGLGKPVDDNDNDSEGDDSE